MLAEICSRIAGRQFVALGYCRIPQSDSPIFIPADLFNGTGVANGNDILDDIVVARGMSYEGVKILPCKHALAIAHIGAEITGTATFQDVAKNTQRKRGGSGPNRLGRPSVKDAIHELIAHLVATRALTLSRRCNSVSRISQR